MSGRDASISSLNKCAWIFAATSCRMDCCAARVSPARFSPSARSMARKPFNLSPSCRTVMPVSRLPASLGRLHSSSSSAFASWSNDISGPCTTRFFASYCSLSFPSTGHAATTSPKARSSPPASSKLPRSMLVSMACISRRSCSPW